MDNVELRQARQRMVENQLEKRDIRDPRVLEAMGAVPRHLFVPANKIDHAYNDGALPISKGQTISQPYIVALMSQLLELSGDETVLEVGTGSGYAAAILARLAARVHTIERIPSLARKARRLLLELGVDNVSVYEGDGSLGLPEYAPYEGILVAAGSPKVPLALKDQLADQGNLVVPVGDQRGQMMERWIRRKDKFTMEHIAPVAFVPLVGEEGWSRDDRSLS